MLRKVKQLLTISHQLSAKNIFLCLISALLLILSFPKANIWIFSWFGFIPLFFALKNKNNFQSFILAYLTGLIFWWGIIYWLCHITVLGTAILIFYLSLYFGFFGLCISFTYNSRLKTPYFLLFLPAAWVVLEYLRSYLLTGFPWALLGYSQYLNPEFIQFVDITGAWGGSFLLIFINSAAFLIFAKGLKRNSKLLISIFLAALIFINYNYGWWKIDSLEKIKKIGSIKIASLQGNIPQDMKWDYSSRQIIIDKYLNLSKNVISQGAKLIIWPEASLPVVPQENPQEFDLVSQLCRQSRIPILLGAITTKNDLYFNSALLISGQGEVAAQYDKTHLVPFGEYIPLRRFLPFLETVAPIGDVSRGTKNLVFYLTHGRTGIKYKFSVLICFEDVFPEISRRFVKKGAGFLVNITNDAWYKETSAPYQHMQASVFRAIENRVYLVRSANTGVSCFISPGGVLISKVSDLKNKDIFVEGFISEEVVIFEKKETIYTKYGEMFVIFCLIILILPVLFIPTAKRLKRLIKKKNV